MLRPIPVNPAIIDTARRLNTQLLAANGLLLWWHNDKLHGGLPLDRICIVPSWEPREQPEFGMPVLPMRQFPAHVSELLERAELTHRSSSNRSKVMAYRVVPPHDDNPQMEVEFGALDFDTSARVTLAFTHPLCLEGDGRKTLRELYEDRSFSLLRDCFGHVVVHLVVRTADECLLIMLRRQSTLNLQGSKGIKRLGLSPGTWSISCEEGFEPHEERDFFGTICRCLEEEWGLGLLAVKRGFCPAKVRLLAAGREWGDPWNTGFAFSVDLPGITGREALQNWQRATSRDEAAAIGTVSVARPEEREWLADIALQNGLFDVDQASERVQAKFVAYQETSPLHKSTGCLRLALALGHWYGMRFCYRAVPARARKRAR